MPLIDSILTTWPPRLLSIFRIIVGLLFLEHGTSKYLSLPVSPTTGVSLLSLSGINGVIELVGGVLIVLLKACWLFSSVPVRDIRPHIKGAASVSRPGRF